MTPEAYRGTTAYARAKRAQVVLSHDWARRWGADGVASYAWHPGWVDTPGLASGLPTFAKLGPLLRTPGGRSRHRGLAGGRRGQERRRGTPDRRGVLPRPAPAQRFPLPLDGPRRGSLGRPPIVGGDARHTPAYRASRPPRPERRGAERLRDNMVTLDHLILTVNDHDASVRFYTEVMAFGVRGRGRAPSRSSGSGLTPRCSWRHGGPRAVQHLAFALSADRFDAAFARVRAAGLPYGDSFHDVGNMRGPGEETGARGLGPTALPVRPQRAPGRAASLGRI